MGMGKRTLAGLLAAVLLAAGAPQAAFAEGGTAGGLCEHHTEHTADCGYTEGAEGTPCTYVCEICNPQDSGEIEESVTEEERGSGAEGDGSVSEGETPQGPVEEPETKATEETTIPAETPAPVTNAVARAGSTEQTESSVAKVETNGTVTYYDSLNEAVHAISDVRGTGTITLLQNASLTGWSAVPMYGNITLIGNNYTINGDSAGISVYGTLYIQNCNFSDSAPLPLHLIVIEEEP